MSDTVQAKRDQLEQLLRARTSYAGVCVHQMFERWADRTPDSLALVSDDHQMSYGLLESRTNQLAGYLRNLGVGPDVRVGIYLNRGSDLVVALLGVLKAGAAYVPLDPAMPANRVARLLDDIQAPVILTTQLLSGELPSGWASVICLDTDWPGIAREDSHRPTVAVSPSNLAYVLYTSGSTGAPKGVGIEHRNLANYVSSVGERMGLGRDTYAMVSTFGADLGNTVLFGSLCLGGTLHVIDVDRAQDPSSLANYFERHHIDVVKITPSHLGMLLGSNDDPSLMPLKTLVLGGEASDPGWVASIQRLRPPCRIWNHYGPTETTVGVLSQPLSLDGDTPKTIALGRPFANTQAHVLDAFMEPVRDGLAGELYVGGSNVSRGYHLQPGLTAERFVPNPFSERLGARLYRTGDLVSRLPDGALEFLGRADTQIKLRGFRIEPGEIEAALLEEPGVRQARVILREDMPGDARLVAYVVAEPEDFDAARTRAALAAKLPDFMNPSALVRLDSLPLTANGKLDRNALPKPKYESGTGAQSDAPRTAVEEILAGIWAEVLHVEHVGRDANFFELGGHSLLATQAVSRMRGAFDVEIPLQALFDQKTLAGLASEVERIMQEGAVSDTPPLVPAGGDRSMWPLSFAQQRLWIIDQLEPGNSAYNIPRALRLNGDLNVMALRASLSEMSRRHEVLRTSFPVLDGQPIQRIEEPCPADLPIIDLTGLDADAAERTALRLAREEAGRPFDLATGPLLRCRLIRLSARDHVLLATLHHIVTDAWSTSIVIRELTVLYEAYSAGNASPLPELPVQYADYAVWQRQCLRGNALDRQMGYWRTQLAGLAPLELPADYARPSAPSYNGAVESFRLDTELSARLQALSRGQGVTLFMTALAAWQLLLSRYSGQDDIVVGSPIAGRNRAETEGLIGFFLNTLVLRTDLSGNPSFIDLLDRVRGTSLAAYGHQDIPFEQLVEEIAPVRDLSRHPLFQVMFILQHASQVSLSLNDVVFSSLESARSTAKFDLTLSLTNTREGLTGSIEYAADLFLPATIARMAGHFENLLSGIVISPEARAGDLSLLSEAERRQLLSEFNDTQAKYPADACMHHLFEQQAARTPKSVAVVFADQALTYAELDARANQLANYLRKLGVGPDVLVGLCVERSLDMVAGLLGILKAGGAYVPLDPDYPSERLDYVISDSRMSVLVTQDSLVTRLTNPPSRLVRLDGEAPQIAREPEMPAVSAVSASNMAYVIYTSGSTGRPKGVAISHQAVVNFLLSMQKKPGITAQDTLVSVTTLSFDICGLEIYLPLIAGARVVIAPRDTAGDGGELAGLLAREGATMMQATPATWKVMRQAGWAPSSGFKMLCGGEALPNDLAAALTAANGGELWNMYGPTETTIWSAIAHLSPGEPITIGKPIDNTQITILDRYFQPVPVGVPGELYIGGAGLARGYLGRPDLTAEKFVPSPFSSVPGERLYRVGDLCRYRPDGNIEFLGRVDLQVKIRGFRIELGEIEVVLAAHPAIQDAAVVAREDSPGDSRLVAYAVSRDKGLSAADLRPFLRSSLPEYMVPSAFVFLESLPLTPNGKVDRKALPAPNQDIALAGTEVPCTLVEELVAQIWADVLHVERVGRDAHFFELGGHSLLATQVVSRVRTLLDVEIPLRVLFEAPALSDFSERVEAIQRESNGSRAPQIVRSSREGVLPVSFAQQRLWFIDQLEPGNAIYNMPTAIRISGPINPDALERTFNEIVSRHEALRTVFRPIDGQPVQVIRGYEPFPLKITSLEHLPLDDRDQQARQLAQQEAARPFDLGTGPLMRVGLLRLGEQEHVVLLTMHHIISDGWSIGLLIKEVVALYEAYSANEPSPLPELAIQYADFAAWQRQWLQGEILDKQLGYWRGQLAGLPTLDLPTDHPRPAVQSYRGARAGFRLPAEVTRAVNELSRRESATMFMALLAAWQLLMSRYSGQNDIVVGSPIAGRNRAETEDLIGFFVNTLVLRTDLSGNPSFTELLRRVRGMSLAAYGHQDLPFEQLVEEVAPARDLSRQPLFQISLVLQNAPPSSLAVSEVMFSPLESEQRTAKFDLTVNLTETGGGLAGFIEYATDLFELPTIVRFIDHFYNLLSQITLSPEAGVSDLSFLSEAERRQLLVEFNDTQADYPKDACAHQGFEEQVLRTPESLAVVCGNEKLTYAELNARANQLAHYLQTMGVGPDALVGLLIARGVEMVVGLLGILKAGGAYVPLDPDLPTARLEFIVRDGGLMMVLTDERSAGRVPADSCPMVSLDGQSGLFRGLSENNPACAAGPKNLAYVIYTSGSTGNPKGSLIVHQGLVNYLAWATRAYDVATGAGSPVHSPLSFDLTVTSLLPPLMCGRAVTLLPANEPVEELTRVLLDAPSGGWSLLKLTPAHLQALRHTVPDAAAGGARALVIGGEALVASDIAFWREHAPNTRLINEYGPTETVVGCCVYEVDASTAHDGPIPIGRPIANTQLYVLDKHLQPVPTGVPGDLYIAGTGLARGYLGQPDLTADRFIPNPFSPEPGARLYKTGDLCRYRNDGILEFQGREDDQVKVRGFRIELGEIETVLREHEKVEDAVVLAREDSPGDKRLVAYITNSRRVEDSDGGAASLVSDWNETYEYLYAQAPDSGDPAFNIAGWDSSVTGEAIPAEEMREWTEATVERILGLNPGRVLEIGCGTGLLLWRVAPHCSHYLGTDFSRAVIARLEKRLAGNELSSRVSLLSCRADHIDGVEPGSFDTVIMNSVAQYFPNAEYLLRAIEQAVNAVAAGGSVFIGDVRSLPLLDAFHTWVQRYSTPPEDDPSAFWRNVGKMVASESELAIDPLFFHALSERFPNITHVEVSPKRGQYLNEMTRYRYDVTLHVGNPDRIPETPCGPAPTWLYWREEGMTLASLSQQLREASPRILYIADVPNARVAGDSRLTQLLSAGVSDAAQLRNALTAELGVDPDDLWRMAEDLGYAVDMSWLSSRPDGALDIIIRRADETAFSQMELSSAFSSLAASRHPLPFDQLTNNPSLAWTARDLMPELRAYAGGRLPEYMIPSAFVFLDSLPLTFNGKVDRKALPPPEQEIRQTAGEAPRTPIEELMGQIWSDVLHVERVGRDDNFFELGGHSLVATRVISRVRTLMDVEVPLRVLFEAPTLREFSERVEALQRESGGLQAPPIIPCSRENPLPVSFAQQRLWFIDQLEPDSSVYNMPLAIKLTGPLNTDALEQTFNEITRRHEALRTTFDAIDGEPVQVIHPYQPLPLKIDSLEHLPALGRDARARQLAQEESGRSFNLSDGPLMRVSLLRLGDQEHVVLLTMHHIIGDGWSLNVLVKEVVALYEAYSAKELSPLPDLAIQYPDFAVWQRQWLQGDVMEKQLAYWREQLADLPTLELPTDYPRPPVQSYLGARTGFRLSVETTRLLNSVSRREGSTLYMTLLAAWQLLLSRYSGQDDIVVGTSIAGRNRAETEDLIGFFANTLILRGDLSGNPSFAALLHRVRAMSLAAYGHQDIPFEQLVEEVAPARDLSRNPLFQVLFDLHNVPPGTLSMSEVSFSTVEAEQRNAKFDLELNLFETADGLSAGIQYATDLFERSTMERMAGHFHTVLTRVAANPEMLLDDLSLLTDTERHQLLVEFNATRAAYPSELCVHHLFEKQAARTPNAPALIFGDEQLTYADLNDAANRVAARLQRQGGRPDALFGILSERGSEFLIAVLAIFKAGGAYLPLDPLYPPSRIATVLEQSGAAHVLVAKECLSLWDSALALLPAEHAPAALTADARVIGMDIGIRAEADSASQTPSSDSGGRLTEQSLVPSGVSRRHLAYVIYTSGTTGMPKGAMIDHGGMLNHLHAKIDDLGLTSGDHIAQVASQCFDISVWQFLAALVVGGTVTIYPNEITLDGRRLMECVRRDGITILEIVPSMLQTMMSDVVEAGMETSSTSTTPAVSDAFGTLRWMIATGEALPPALARNWVDLFPTIPLMNACGPTECSDDVTHYVVPPNFSDQAARVLVGKPIRNTSLYILDNNGNPLPAGLVGELYVGGDGVGRGYRNEPERTALAFLPDPFRDSPGHRMYRTGDLARYLGDGTVDLIGRVDTQVKIRGFRIELGEIEAVLSRIPAMDSAIVVAREDHPGDKRLVAYLVAKPDQVISIPEVGAFLKTRLPEYMIPSGFAVLDALPLTANGKVDRKALPAVDMERGGWTALYEPPVNLVEEVLAGIWRHLLRVERIGRRDNFFELGGHSLLATQVVSRIRNAFRIDLPLRVIFEAPVLAECSERVQAIQRESAGLQAPPITRSSRDSAPPLSFAQQRLWFLDQLEPGSTAYNVPAAVKLTGPFDTDALEWTLNEIVRRHEALRTTFSTIDSQPVQVVHPYTPFKLAITSLEHLPPEERGEQARQLAQIEGQSPFSLENGPLIRVSLLRLSAEEHVALFTVHHIISDGWSMGLLIKEVGVLYAAFSAGEPSPLPEPSYQYADFAVWQRNWLKGEVLAKQLGYWRGQLADLPTLELPTDRPRSAVQSHKGAGAGFRLSVEVTRSLKELSQREGATMFMTLLAAWQLLLSRYSGQDDIVVGSPIAGRNHSETEDLIGFFVNSLVLRTGLSGDPAFTTLLRRVRETCLSAYAHQDVPFEQLVEELHPVRDTSRHPLFQVMLVLQNVPGGSMDVSGLTLQSIATETVGSKFDLSLNISEGADRLSGMLRYSTDLFDASTIDQILSHFGILLEQITVNPDRGLSELSVLSQEEKHTLLYERNATAFPYPADLCVHKLFEAQVERAPMQVAVAMDGREISYRELNNRANQLARYLRELGVGPNTLVCLCVERSIEMIVGIFGILKAGGAYVPLDPGYPKERLAAILSDTRSSVLLTQRPLLDRLPECAATTICLDTDWNNAAAKSVDNLICGATPDDFIYVIYTSGSTGTPKGVSVYHRGFINLLHWFIDTVGITGDDRTLLVSSLSFDLTQKNIYAPLLTGGRLYLSSARYYDVEVLRETVSDHQITLLNCTPSVFYPLVDVSEGSPAACGALRAVILGGEPISLSRLEPWWSLPGRETELFNTYGPTECTDIAACHRVSRDERLDPPIGRPVANTQVFILGRHLDPVPARVPGELCISGAGVGNGYLNDSVLTAEKFIPHPFSPEPGERLYRTGDLARYRTDGTIEYLGRIDKQVKIRGFRIELDEIRAVLLTHPKLREAVVTAQAASGGDQQLVAYTIPETPVSSEDLRDWLKQRLPEYMVPAAFVCIDELPLNQNGKLDYDALPAPGTAHLQNQEHTEPRTPLEQLLADLWKEVLNIERISVFDNFFHVGGDSLKAAVAINRLQGILGRIVYVVVIFDQPTIAELAAHLMKSYADTLPEHLRDPVDEKAARSSDAPDQPTARIDLSKIDQLRQLIRKGNS